MEYSQARSFEYILVAHLLVLPGVGESNLNNFAANFIVNFARTFVCCRMDVAAKTQLKCEMDHSNQASSQNYPLSGFLFFDGLMVSHFSAEKLMARL